MEGAKEVIIYSEKNDNRIFIFEVNYLQCTNAKAAFIWSKIQ